MARERRPSDWERDLAAARGPEDELEKILRADKRVTNLQNNTATFDLDFSFDFDGGTVWLDLKEKINKTSQGLADLWPEVPADDLFVLDETVYRRIVWHGGGGYLAIHDHPCSRWVLFGPWELTLGPKLRYQRWEKKTTRFLKGKMLLDLRIGVGSESFAVDDLLQVIERSRAEKEQVEAVRLGSEQLPEIGK